MERDKVRVGLLGMGTVGRGVYRLLQDNAPLITRRVGIPVEVGRVLVRDRFKDRGIAVPEGILTDCADDILRDPAIDIVVEVMGGTGLARELVLKALSQKKSVVTANKDMMAAFGKELFAAAQANGRDLFFEAGVAGGIPIIRVLKECLAGDRIRQVMGIVNGTTNYMLTRMSREGAEFDAVLRAAQAAGYAEADPTNDVEGYDAARKIAILASIAFNTRIALDDVYVEGITRITAEDIRYAAELGYAVKLLGIARDTPEGVEVRVHPALLPQSHPLAAVNDVFNAVFVEGEAVGETMFYGRGAGELPTASAVVADVIDAARNLRYRVPGIISCTCFTERPVKPMGRVVSRNYLRLRVIDRPGVLAQIAFVFGENQVSLASVIQKQTVGAMAELVLITHDVAEENLHRALTTLAELPVVDRVFNVIRVVDGA
ncbi:MAG: homoserine dehydrogenase [Thermoanaerobacterales bacterium]|nr:homoserine dehydrogenase [Bacillota bacterium]MDI6907177.1 homoserine dehydrogenase [Thermoanaerobacterales bacterium]